MRILMLVLLVLTPVAAAQAPEGWARVEWEGDADLASITTRQAGCAAPVFDMERVPQGFRFVSDEASAGCGEVVLQTDLPPGTERIDVRFLADRSLEGDPLNRGIAGFEQSLRLYGPQMEAHAYIAPEAGPRGQREYVASFNTTTGERALAWHFHDAAGAGRAVSAEVRQIQMSVTVPVPAEVRLRSGILAELDADLVRPGEVVVQLDELPESDLRPTLVVVLESDAVAGTVRGPSGEVLEPQVRSTDGRQEVRLGPEALEGPGTYAFSYQVPATLASKGGLASGFFGLVLALPVTTVFAAIAVEMYARTAARDRPGRRRVARGATVVLGTAMLLALVQVLVRQDPRIMMQAPLHPVATAQYMALGGILVLLILLLLTIGVSMLRTLRQRLRQRTQEGELLAQANDQLEHFAATAAHDLASPLKSMRLTAQILAGSSGLRSDKDREMLEGIQDTSARMARLVEAMLGYSRLNDARPDLERTDVDALVRPVLHDLGALISERRADVRIDGSGKVLCDLALMRRAVQNLVENAIKYSDGRPWVRVRLRQVGPDARLSVADHGRGIDQKDLERVQEPFQRGTSSNGRDGTGLGLATVRRIAALHGGHLDLTSRPGRGTTITLVFPAEGQRTAQEAAAPRRSDGAAPPAAARPRRPAGNAT